MNIFFLFFVFFWYYNSTWVLSSTEDQARLHCLWQIGSKWYNKYKKEINSKLYFTMYCDIMFDYVWNTVLVFYIYEHQSQWGIWSHKKHTRNMCVYPSLECNCHCWFVLFCDNKILAKRPFPNQKNPTNFLNKPETLHNTTIVNSVSIVWCLERERF